MHAPLRASVAALGEIDALASLAKATPTHTPIPIPAPTRIPTLMPTPITYDLRRTDPDTVTQLH